MSDHETKPDRVFLDANVLMAASITPLGGSAKLWVIPGIELVSSEYAYNEAFVNLAKKPATEQSLARLDEITQIVDLRPHRDEHMLFPPVLLTDLADVPILNCAIESECQYLLTLDMECFGKYVGTTIAGVFITKPGLFLQNRGV